MEYVFNIMFWKMESRMRIGEEYEKGARFAKNF